MGGDWIEGLAIAAVPSAAPWPEIDVNGQPVVLLRDSDGRIHAARSSCPHLGAPLTSASVVDGSIECARHFFAWDCASGVNTAPRMGVDERLAILDVEVRNDIVWVRPRPADGTAPSPAGA